MEYTLRKTKATETFLITTIISKIGIREIKHCFNAESTKDLIENVKNEEGKTTDQIFTAIGIGVALDILGVILGNMKKCETEIFELVAALANMKVEEVRELDQDVFLEMLLEVIKNNSKDFIGVASKLFKLAK